MDFKTAKRRYENVNLIIGTYQFDDVDLNDVVFDPKASELSCKVLTEKLHGSRFEQVTDVLSHLEGEKVPVILKDLMGRTILVAEVATVITSKPQNLMRPVRLKSQKFLDMKDL